MRSDISVSEKSVRTESIELHETTVTPELQRGRKVNLVQVTITEEFVRAYPLDRYVLPDAADITEAGLLPI